MAFSTVATQSASGELLKLNCLLAKLTRSSQFSDALQLFAGIHFSGFLKPDHYSLSSALKACSNLGDVVVGNQIHALAFKSGFRAYSHVGNTLLSLYAKSEDSESMSRAFREIENPDVYSWTTLLSGYSKLGESGYAYHVFDNVPNKSTAVWNALITGYADNGDSEAAFLFFKQMHRMGVSHDNYSIASILSLCNNELILKDFGRQVHALVIKIGFFVAGSVVNSLLTMYFHCQNAVEAYEVFEEVGAEVRDQISFNAMIAGLVSLKRDEEALMMYREMLEACERPTELTFVSVVGSCLSRREGHQVHAQIIKMGFEPFTSISNVLITMYAVLGDLAAATMIFHNLEDKDLVSWNSVISAHAQPNCGKLALLFYLQMQATGYKPDEYTVGSLLGSSEFVESVDMIHALVYTNGLVSRTQVGNALVSAYSKHGRLHEALLTFHLTPSKNLVSWNTLISGFLLNGLPFHGLEQFAKMLKSETRPNIYTLGSALSSCSCFSALRQGKEIHGYILRLGFCAVTSLRNALIAMYAKCGFLNKALSVFNGMIDRDVVSWNTIISAYAQHGEGEEAVESFEKMVSSGAKPDDMTFTSVLSACSHAGLVCDGARIFYSMLTNYGFIPNTDHLSCIVDLLGRAGYLDEAERLINSEPFELHPSMLWALYSACVAHGNLRLGRAIAGVLLQTEESNTAVYVLLSNIYAAAEQWNEAADARKLMGSTGVLKDPGCSWIRL